MTPVRLDRAAAVALFAALSVCLTLIAGAARADHVQRTDISEFVGDYTGSAAVVSADGSEEHRNMSVSIGQTKKGFTVAWTTVTHKPIGKTKEKSYEIEFQPTDREGIYSAAQRQNLFGHAVQLDPMKGEPFVWGRIVGDMLTVYSLFVDDEGGYEMQQYDRTLVEGGLQLEFSRFRDSENLRSVSAFLERQ